MSFRNPHENRATRGAMRKQPREMSAHNRLTLHNSHCPCACRHILVDILEDDENNIIKRISFRMGKEGFSYYLGFLSGAQFCLEHGNNADYGENVRSPTSSGRENELAMVFCWLPTVLAAICGKAMEMGMEEGWVRKFVQRCNVFPDRHQFGDGSWPWPVKIYTLGKFELVLDGRPVGFPGKAQKKPLQILKALIALGGNEVREEQITDLLWPEADGDRAHSAFTTTLLRLRRFVGVDGVIEIHDGKASINPRCCWVDLWAFEELCGQVDSMLEEMELEKGKKINRKTVIQLAERAIAMYGGPPFPDEADPSWAAPLRRRLGNRFIRLINEFGRFLETMGDWEKAAKYYHMALEKNETADEEIYQRLMICHHQLQQPARAIEVYRLCRRALAAIPGTRPSSRTEIIFKELIQSMEAGGAQGGSMA